ncbi:MAG: hypothetical protein LBH25_07270 [Fibromonadaceae bacterium]|jgi:uncharacterized membrane protein|nr:hypothetical protein [Fibromonadaceae bacterium]
MDEKQIEQTFNELFGSLTGPSKWIATKILKNDFADKVKRILNNSSVEKASEALKKLIETATQKTASVIRLKIAMVLTIIIGILTVLAIIGASTVGGNIMLPIVVSVILIAIIWFVTGIISKFIVRKISGIIFKVIEGKITQFIAQIRTIPQT